MKSYLMTVLFKDGSVTHDQFDTWEGVSNGIVSLEPQKLDVVTIKIITLTLGATEGDIRLPDRVERS